MEQSKIDWFVANNSDKFAADKMQLIVEKMQTMSDDKFVLLQTTSLTNPTVALVLSLFCGWLGLDRFIIGDVGAGVAKLLTFGGCGIWWFIDLFLIGRAARTKNFNKLAIFLM